jgi:hypothetical protein
MGFENLLVEDRGALRVITVNRPQALNALSRRVVDEPTGGIGGGLEGDDRDATAEEPLGEEGVVPAVGPHVEEHHGRGGRGCPHPPTQSATGDGVQQCTNGRRRPRLETGVAKQPELALCRGMRAVDDVDVALASDFGGRGVRGVRKSHEEGHAGSLCRRSRP